jgi:hypothetical protein
MHDAEVSRRRLLTVLGAALLAACGGATRKSSQTEGTSPTSETITSPPTSEADTVSAPTTAVPVVPGSNSNITDEILTLDARGCDGSWSATWRNDRSATPATITGAVTIDPNARTLTAHISVAGDLLGDGVAIPAFSVGGSVDSYTYADDGTFAIDKATPVGDATMTSVGGMGTGQFHLKVVNIPSHPTVTSFEASGTANRAGVIPATLTVTFTDGTKATGTCQFSHSPG